MGSTQTMSRACHHQTMVPTIELTRARLVRGFKEVYNSAEG